MADDRHEITFAMVKPHAYKHREDIEGIIESAGMYILCRRDHAFNKKDAREHYREHVEKPFFHDIEEMIVEGTSSMYVVGGTNAISELRKLSGPTDPAEARKSVKESIRAKYGIDKCRNAIHASDSESSALREIKLHFNADEMGSAYRKILSSYRSF